MQSRKREVMEFRGGFPRTIINCCQRLFLVVRPVLKTKTGFRTKSGISKVYRDMIKSFTGAYMNYIIKRKCVFTRYFEVCKVHLP